MSAEMIESVLSIYPLEDWRGAFHEGAALHDITRTEIEKLKVDFENTGADTNFAQRERSSCLKFIIVMAVKNYRYDLAVPRNSAMANITNDLIELGIGLDVDTVRKWLKEAAEQLPPKKAE